MNIYNLETMKKKKITLTIASMLFSSLLLWAGNPDDSLKLANWQNLDPEVDKLWGVKTDKAYKELLKGKESKTVIVAVIDNGVDISHEDLKDFIWVNEDEIPDNGIDDDKNGYIDDVHGWNFLGNADGENIDKATLEMTRLYKIYNDLKEDSADELTIPKKIDESYFEKVEETFKEESGEYVMLKSSYTKYKNAFLRYDSILSELIGTENYTLKDVKKLKVEKKSTADTAKKLMTNAKKSGVSLTMLDGGIKYFDNRLNYHFNPDYEARSIIGDNVWQWSDMVYGNNNVSAASPDHGTMVSSIIGANRNNNIGVKGIADNIVIMPIRTVPDGDEWDKDVAKAIEYAIKNGAQIINMSFGKSFSPQKEFVDKIAKMADEYDVLLVHAAGNDSKNIDIKDNFPNKYLGNNEVVDNWITVGASSRNRKKKEFIASFSNYGKKSVDLFAPGHNLLMCAPGDKYKTASGTSFAAPMVSGAAALLRSYYPNFTASEIKDILLESSEKKDSKVLLPGTSGKNKKIVPFSSLSQSGGLLDVYNAILLAEQKSKTKN
jgi:subtilisin family serine protease